MIGAAAGVCGFYALYRFAGSITAEGRINVLWALAFALLPPVVLVAVALLLTEQLLPAGVAMTAALVLCAVFLFTVRALRRKQKPQDRNEGSEKE